MKAAIYARVSTLDKDQNPEVQLQPMREYCISMTWAYQEYVDTVPAADFEHRTAWNRMMKDASLRKFDVVLVWKLDRAFRSLIHAKNTVDTLRRYGIHFRSLGDPGIDTNTPNGELLFNILAAFAQYEKDIIAQRVAAGMEYARLHGTRSGSPIGRPSYNIPFANICKALIRTNWSYSGAAKLINQEFKTRVSPAFIFTRVKRSGKTREEIIQEYGSSE